MFKKIFLTIFLVFCLIASGWCAGRGINFHNTDINKTLNEIFNVQADFATVTLTPGVLQFEGTINAYKTTLAVTDPTANRTITFPDRAGVPHLGSTASALTPAGAVALTVGLSNVYTDTPTDNEDQTITFSGAGTAGEVISIIFTSVSTGDEVITFHATLVSSTGTLTIGTTAARYYVITFISNGTHWFEVSRTAAST